MNKGKQEILSDYSHFSIFFAAQTIQSRTTRLPEAAHWHSLKHLFQPLDTPLAQMAKGHERTVSGHIIQILAQKEAG